MRCLSCNAALSDFEATRKSALTGEYTDLCNHCFSTVSEQLLTIERQDLAHEAEDVDDVNHCGLDVVLDNDDELC